MSEVSATYYDGRSSEKRLVVIHLDGSSLRVVGEANEKNISISDIRVSFFPAAKNAHIYFQLGGHVRIPVSDEAKTLIQQLRREQRSQPITLFRRFGVPICVVAVLVVAIVNLYGGILRTAADLLPESMVRSLGEKQREVALAMFTEPSRLSAERRARIESEFKRLARASVPEGRFELLFRGDASNTNPNAFACGNGTIVLLDSIVDFAGSDEALLGILAHEIGHVAERHHVRFALQDSFLSTILRLSGDSAAIFTAAASKHLIRLKYSRDMEREADHFAYRTLKEQGISTAPLSDFFSRMAARQSSDEDFAWGYFSTHPKSDERKRVK